MDDKKERDPIPEQFNSLKEAGEFWDTHSFEDYLDLVEEVDMEFDIQHRYYLVPVREELYQRIKSYAEKHDHAVEELVDHFLENELVRMRAA